MQLFPQSRDTIEKIALFVRSLGLWTLELVALWVKLFGDRNGRIDLRRRLRALRRDTRLVFMIAVAARLRFNDGPIARTFPFRTPRGVRYRRRRPRWARLITRGIKLDSLADIRAALDDFDAHVARAFARLPKRFLAGRLVNARVDGLVRAPLCAVGAPAEAHDTS